MLIIRLIFLIFMFRCDFVGNFCSLWMRGIGSNFGDVSLGLRLVLMFMIDSRFIFCAIVQIIFYRALTHLFIILVESLCILCFLIISGVFLIVPAMNHSNFSLLSFY